MRILFITLLLFFSVYANAGIYKWTDKNGNVQYGDKPTASSEQLDISVEAPSSSTEGDETREERRQRITESMTDERLAREKKKTEEKEKKAEMNRQCVESKDRLMRYKRAGRLYNLDKGGNRNTLSDASREKAISDLEKQIRKNCK